MSLYDMQKGFERFWFEKKKTTQKMSQRKVSGMKENVIYQTERKWLCLQGKLQKRDKSKQGERREKEWKMFQEEMQRDHLKTTS